MPGGAGQAQQDLRGSIPGGAAACSSASQAGPGHPLRARRSPRRPDRGIFFVKPTHPVYVGQIVGEIAAATRENDIEVNVSREKKLTNPNARRDAASADKTVVLKPPRVLRLELALEFIEDDELVEVTPDAKRLWKRRDVSSLKRTVDEQTAPHEFTVAAMTNHNVHWDDASAGKTVVLKPPRDALSNA